MTRPEEYDALQSKDVRKAFKRAYNEIEEAQENLRKTNPKSPLLGLIKLREDRDGLDFDDSFKPIVMEHSDFPETTNWYYALGFYVDLLIDELDNPKYPSN
jgi:hypothetical protein